MFKAARTFAIVFGICVLLVGLVSVANAAARITWRVIDPHAIKDKDGVTNLPVGSYVQLWNVTDPDRTKHVLLDEAAIGAGLARPGAVVFQNRGQLAGRHLHAEYSGLQ